MIENFLGQRIRTARNGRFTQDDLAKELGVTKAAVSRWESGSRMPTLEHLLRLSRILNKPPGYFLPDPLSDSDITAFEEGIVVYDVRQGRLSQGASIRQLWDFLGVEKPKCALRLEDDELSHAGYHRGDILLVQPSRNLDNQDLILVREQGAVYQVMTDKTVIIETSGRGEHVPLKITGFFRLT